MVRKPTIDGRRAREIGHLAEAVAHEHCGETTVEPELILRDLRITLSYDDYGGCFDGMLEVKDSRWHVYCDVNKGGADSPRARFTLGHELGRYFIDEHRQALLSGVAPHASHCERSPLLVEQEADLFSSHLLLPTARLLKTLSRDRGLPGARLAANDFRTSYTSTALRLVTLDREPCVLIKWSPDGTFEWKRISASAYRDRVRKTVEDAGRLPADCATQRVLAGDAEDASCGSVRSAWLPFVSRGSYKDHIVLEQAL